MQVEIWQCMGRKKGWDPDSERDMNPRQRGRSGTEIEESALARQTNAIENLRDRESLMVPVMLLAPV